MARKISNEQINEMICLYDKLKTYSAVARQMGISASTASRYIKERQAIKTYSNNEIIPKPIEEIKLADLTTFSFLTIEEEESYMNWLKEFKK